MFFHHMTTANADIALACWLKPASGCVVLTEDWDSETMPELALSSDNVHLVNTRPAPCEFVGRWFGYYRRDGSVVFCQEAHRHPQVDFEATGVIVAGPFNDWGRKGQREVWQLKRRAIEDGSEIWECAVPAGRLALDRGAVVFKFVSTDWHWLKVLPQAPNRASDGAGNENYLLQPGRGGHNVFLFDVDHGRGIDTCDTIRLHRHGRAKSFPIEPGLSFFDLTSSRPVGAYVGRRPGRIRIPVFRRKCTVFRAFAPRASSVVVEFYKPGHEHRARSVNMHLLLDGVTWEAQLSGNLHGWHYFLRVNGANNGTSTQFDAGKRLLDPWALATAGAAGPGIVIDRRRLSNHGARHPFKTPARQDLVIIEGHLRDLIAHAPINLSVDERLGFRGLIRWIEESNSYLRQLGCNALELLPVTQFDSPARHVYHWGYMTTNYFSPCSHYAQHPEKASQIGEFIELVETCHRHGLAVILDVVYNHVGEPAFLLFMDKAVYFHVAADGTLENWSGCGNTLKAGSAMAKRLIIESLVYLIETYNVDNFRFDLAELLTIEVLAEVETGLRAVKADVILIAEPWSFRGNIAWDLRTTGFSFWNDGFREFMVEYVLGHGNVDGLRYYMLGSLDHMAAFPSQSINYVESHDDRCWLDKITENPGHDGRHPTPNDIRRTHLMVAILMCSIGIPMIATGQDFLRSKGGLTNTYIRGDVNALDYGRCQHFSTTHHYFREWIAFRSSSWAGLIRTANRPAPGYVRVFRCDDRSSAALLFNADHSAGPRQLLFAVNPHLDHASIPCDASALGNWLELADHHRFDMRGISTHRMDIGAQRLKLGHLDCALWVRTD